MEFDVPEFRRKEYSAATGRIDHDSSYILRSSFTVSGYLYLKDLVLTSVYFFSE